MFFTMSPDIRPLTDAADLDDVLSRSSLHPVVLFKHSETCGMSFQAREEVQAAVAEPGWPVDVHLISVQRSRPVSNEIALRLGVRHASPQVLLVKDGQVQWQATHMAITARALRTAVLRHASPTS